MTELLIRPFREGDEPALAQVFHRAVRHGAARHYSRKQRVAWSPGPPSGRAWSARLAVADTLVAEKKGVPVGFMTLNIKTGFLDYAYVVPEVMGAGVADALYAILEGRARVAGQRYLETEASHLAERFFVRRGWEVVRRQEVDRGRVSIPNAVMVKTLVRTASAA